MAIDEAQYLSSGILKDLKILMNHGDDSLNCFTLIITGEPHQNHTLEKSIHQALRQRLTVHYNFEGLDDHEISEYIFHKLSIVGASKTLIDKVAISAVHSYSYGNPRHINKVMTCALDLRTLMKRQVIDAEVLMLAIDTQSLF